MTGSNVRIVDNTKYVYGCTIDGNDTLQRNVGYLWKSVTPKVEEDVKLTFVVTDAEAQAGTVQTWLWNFANIGDGSTFRLHLKDIKIEKSAGATNPYIDFLNTKVLYLDEVANTTVAETRGMESYITTASYNELKLKVESLSGCEHFYVPIKGLTSGKKYTIYFDELTTNIALGNSAGYDYGAWVDTGYSYVGKNILWLNKAHRSQSEFPHHCIKSVGSWNNNNTFTFTASATTMYWVWEYAAFSDNIWGNIHLRNVRIQEGQPVKLSMLTVENEKVSNLVENVIGNETSNTTNELVENEVLNTVNNAVQAENANVINNNVLNIVENVIIDETNNNVKNEIYENKISNSIEDDKINKEEKLENTVLENSINIIENTTIENTMVNNIVSIEIEIVN